LKEVKIKGSDILILYEFYSECLQHVEIAAGFFDGWANPPSREKHRNILEKSYKSLVAIDSDCNEIIGFITIISDGILSSHIPLLEVLPRYRKQGIGSELVKRILKEFDDLYMIDLCCDKELQAFYQKTGMMKSHGMVYRNYKYQCGRDYQ